MQWEGELVEACQAHKAGSFLSYLFWGYQHLKPVITLCKTLD